MIKHKKEPLEREVNRTEGAEVTHLAFFEGVGILFLDIQRGRDCELSL